MSRRWRALTYGTAALLVVAGTVCAAAISGVVGQTLAIALLSIGLGGAVLLVFFEVGLSEDHARAREAERERRRRERQQPKAAPPRPRPRPPSPRWRRRP